MSTESARPNRRLLITAAAVALLVIGAFLVYKSRDDGVTGQPPVEVATSFVEAVGASDAEQAISYLGDDADISPMISSVGAQGVEGTLGEFRLLLSFFEATGYKQTLDSCKDLGSSASGTSLRCNADGTRGGVRLTEESIGLWDRHTLGYVEEVGA
jgi:hypothetical protein